MNFNFFSNLFTTIKVSLVIVISLLFLCPGPVAEAKWEIPDLQIKLPNITLSAAGTCPAETDKICVPWIGEYIAGIYKYAIGIVGILATVVIMWGGVIWITAGGNTERVSSAKSWVGASLAGLVLALSSFTILYIINPNLVKFTPIKIEEIEKLESPSGNKQPENCDWSAYPCPSGRNNVTQKLDIAHASVCTNEDKTDENLICCCQFGGTWSFDNYISSQQNDAHDSLNTLLACMRSHLPKGVGRISSISDSDKDGKSIFLKCKNSYSPSECEHVENSCHYGGGTADGSQAVDIGDEEYGTIIKKAASECSAGYILDEGNHIHISTGSCKKK